MSSSQQLLLGEGAGGGAAPVYIEDVFSTWLYSGNSSTQTITNGIDLSTKGGLVWQKDRSQGTGYHHVLQDTARGATWCLFSNLTNAESQDGAGTGFAFNSNGFTIGTSNVKVNASGDNYVSWTFREQAKFFDIVTYTGTGSAQNISHSLGSIPGCMIIKATNAVADWKVYHRSLESASYSMTLNTTSTSSFNNTVWNGTAPTSTVFTVGTSTDVNESGKTYVAYLFAHDAGGFGLTGSDNVISCGSVTANGSGVASINLGYEPQWIMLKNSTNTDSWLVFDNMRGLPVPIAPSPTRPVLRPNIANAEVNSGAAPIPTATGVSWDGSNNALTASNTFIYVAIRRGPMKVPTSGTSVFTPIARSGTGATSTVSNSITTDLIISMTRNTAGVSSGVWDRLRGVAAYLETTGTASESTSSDSVTALNNTAYVLGADSGTDRINRSGYTYANWTFSRAPSVFDVVAYTGTGSNTTQTHNLQAVPELIIVKRRSAVASWAVYSVTTGNTKYLQLQTNNSASTDTTYWNSTTPTSTVFSLGSSATPNQSSQTYIAYLFSTCAGVSKVGSYTGTGALQTVNCGFTSGARYILIKRTDASGDWWTYDSARGISSGNDPYLFLNLTDAEVTGTNYVDTDTTGFKVTAAAPAGLNASGGTYIFLAFA